MVVITEVMYLPILTPISSKFPVLSTIALDIFSIPAMSSEAERAFSGTKYTIGDERARLHMTIIEALECLKSWSRGGLFTNDELSRSIIVSRNALEVVLEL